VAKMNQSVSWQTPRESGTLELISGDGCLETSRASLRAEALERLADAVRQAGPETDWPALLEHRIAELTGYSDCVTVSTGAAALAHALWAAGVQAGDEVILPSYAPVSMADVVLQLNAVPILVDIDEATLHLTTGAVEDAVSDRTTAVVAVHIGGLAVAIGELKEIADRNDLILIEEAIGVNPGILNCSRNQRADILCFRFDAHSHFPINHGGAVCAVNPDLCSRIRGQRLPAAEPVSVLLSGQSHAVSQMTAAWEYLRLDTIRERWRRRCQIAMTWSAGFGGSNKFQVPSESPGEPHCWSQYLLRLNLQRCRIPRIELVRKLRSSGIEAGIHYLPIHMHERYQRLFGYGADTFPVSRNEFLREMTLPIDTVMSDKDVDQVWAEIMEILNP